MAARLPPEPSVPPAPLQLARLAAPLVLAALLAGMAGGLLRAGTPGLVALGNWVPQAAAVHAALMLSAGMGSLIAIERGVAVKQRWAMAAPLASGCGGVLLLAGWVQAGAWLGVLAAVVLLGVHVLVLRRQRAVHTTLLLVASAAWLVGNVLFATGAGMAAVLPWWFTLPVLTIAAERLEMARLTRRHGLAEPLLLAVVALLLAGAVLSSLVFPLASSGVLSGASPQLSPQLSLHLSFQPGPQAAAGGLLFGAALFLLALWCCVFDIARRTLFVPGLPRYMAVCLFGGYAWLALAGWAWAGMALGCPGRDLALHALGLGFIGSMVMAHAPVILPAVARVKLQFGAWFYVPLAALHASLLLRLLGGIGSPALRTAGAQGNVAALLLFGATVLGAAVLWQRRHPAARGKRGAAARV